MQELLRRLLIECERHDIMLRVTHTPGEKLYRPDQTSRGDPIEEPRVRMRQSGFHTIEREFGGFTEVIGAERNHAMIRSEGAGSRLWAMKVEGEGRARHTTAMVYTEVERT